jgi:DNA-binding response OmpR family regulator
VRFVPDPPPFTPDAPAVVLVIDHERDVRALYREYLEFCGLHVIVAADERDIPMEAQVSGPDIIVLDLGIPGVDGFETIRQLKAHPRTSEIPVIALSGKPDEEVLRARAAGADACLSRPCLPSQVARAIRALLIAQRSSVMSSDREP